MKINSIFIYFIIIVFSPLIGRLLKKLLNYYKLYCIYNKSDNLLDLLHNLTPYEFEIWASEYLSFLGYSNITLTGNNPNERSNIICYKDNIKYYVECRKCSCNDLITVDIVEGLLGAMISNNIQNAIILTTSTLTSESKLFISNLPSPYTLEVLSASELDCTYEDFILKIN